MRSRGLTLLEVMLALGVVAVAMLALAAVFISGLDLIARSKEIAVATELGREVVEQTKLNVRQLGFDFIPPGDYVYNGKNGDPALGTPQFPPLPYPSIVTAESEFFIVVSGTQTSADLRRMVVEVHWGERSKIVLETAFHR